MEEKLTGSQAFKIANTLKITFNQEQDLENVIGKFSKRGSKPSKTPGEKIFKLVTGSEFEQKVEETLSWKLVGSLLYIAKQTRPHKFWIVDVLLPFMHKLAISHWLGGKRVLRNVKTTKSLKHVYPRDSDFDLTGQIDAHWNGDHDDRRWRNGFFFALRLSGGAVSWQIKKKESVTPFFCEAEYQGLDRVQEATFSRALAYEMGFQQAIFFGEDTQSCIKMPTNFVMLKKSQHLNTKYHLKRGKVNDRSVQLVYTPAGQLLADLLMKSLP